MNERVEQISKQATDDILGVKVVNQKEFAELLVRECIEVLSEDDGATHHEQLLLNHFGVK